jgi:hypothetical protein
MTRLQGGQSVQFTRDDVARIVASVLTKVLDELNVPQRVEGAAVHPAGDAVFLIDIVMRNLSTRETWGVSLTIPPAKEQTDGLT